MIDNIPEALLQVFTEKGWKLALAESCTGGYASHLLTQCPGASTYFLGSLVTYSSSLKKSLLCVSDSLLLQKGAVCHEVVEQMVAGLFSLCDATIVGAVSGIAGPKTDDIHTPIGTVWMAWGQRGGICQSKKNVYQGERKEIIRRASMDFLREIYMFVKKNST